MTRVAINANSIVFVKQFGFNHSHFTLNALIEITEKIKQSCRSGKFACGVIFNLQKTFDTFNYDIILRKLK